MQSFADYIKSAHTNVREANVKRLQTMILRSRNEQVAALINCYADATTNDAIYTNEKIINLHYCATFDVRKLEELNLFAMLCTIDLHVAAKLTTIDKRSLSATLMSIDYKSLSAEKQRVVYRSQRHDDKTDTQVNYCIAALKRMNVLSVDSVTKCFKINADADALKIVRDALAKIAQ